MEPWRDLRKDSRTPPRKEQDKEGSNEGRTERWNPGSPFPTKEGRNQGRNDGTREGTKKGNKEGIRQLTVQSRRRDKNVSNTPDKLLNTLKSRNPDVNRT